MWKVWTGRRCVFFQLRWSSSKSFAFIAFLSSPCAILCVILTPLFSGYQTLIHYLSLSPWKLLSHSRPFTREMEVGNGHRRQRKWLGGAVGCRKLLPTQARLKFAPKREHHHPHPHYCRKKLMTYCPCDWKCKCFNFLYMFIFASCGCIFPPSLPSAVYFTFSMKSKFSLLSTDVQPLSVGKNHAHFIAFCFTFIKRKSYHTVYYFPLLFHIFHLRPIGKYWSSNTRSYEGRNKRRTRSHEKRQE